MPLLGKVIAYRSQLGHVPSDVLSHCHHLIDNRVQFGRIQHSVPVRVVQPEHDCKGIWISEEWKSELRCTRALPPPNPIVIRDDLCNCEIESDPLTLQFVFGASSLEQGQVTDDILQRHLQQQRIEEGWLPANQPNVGCSQEEPSQCVIHKSHPMIIRVLPKERK